MEFFQFKPESTKKRNGTYLLKGSLNIQGANSFIRQLREEMQLNSIKKININEVEEIDACFLQTMVSIINKNNNIIITWNVNKEITDTINKLGFSYLFKKNNQ